MLYVKLFILLSISHYFSIMVQRGHHNKKIIYLTLLNENIPSHHKPLKIITTFAYKLFCLSQPSGINIIQHHSQSG